MSNPYAGRRSVKVAETESPLQLALRRVAALGGDRDDLAVLAEAWPPEPELIEWFLTAADAEVRAAIVVVHDEWELGTHDEEEQAQLDYERRVVAAWDEVAARCAGNIASVVEWVGADRAKADVVEQYETSEVGGRRKGVLVYVRGVLDGAGT